MKSLCGCVAKVAAAMIVVAAMWLCVPAAGEGLDCAGVPTDSGKVNGTALEKTGVCEFEGIPFAAPPVGELRFAMPQPPEPWEDALDAAEAGSECVQYPLMSLVSGKGEVMGSEDCLYLNVWQPFSSALEPKPVMVFIHGGGFISGSASGDLIDYNGAKLASRGDVVVVTVNYRLGVLGFFSHPGLAESGGRGNYGIYDQIAALKWVRNNIANFGGDPDRVSIFGESAGGMSVGILVLSPESGGLFRRAIIESGPMTYLGRTFEDADSEGLEIAGLLGCGDAEKPIECLRAVDAVVLHETAKPSMHVGAPDDDDEPQEPKAAFSFGPTMGGALIPEHPMKMISQGRYNSNVEQIIVGSNKDEMSYFTLMKKVDTPELFYAELEKDIREIEKRYGVKADTEKAKELYPLDDYKSPRKAYNALLGDMAFTCPSLLASKLFAAAGADTYLYHFAKAPDERGLAKDWGAFHGAELPFIFGQFNLMGMSFKSNRNIKVAKDVIALWSSFAHTGVPAAADVPDWPKFDPAEGAYLWIDLESEVRTSFKPDQCGYFETLMKSNLD